MDSTFGALFDGMTIMSKCGRDSLNCSMANWSIIGQMIPSELSIVLVQSFFIIRLSKLAQTRWGLILHIFPLTGLFFSAAYVMKCYRLPSFRMRTLLQTLSLWTVATCLLTCFVTLAYTALVRCNLRNSRWYANLRHAQYITMPFNMWYIAVYFTHPKFYVNAMLAAYVHHPCDNVEAKRLIYWIHMLNTRKRLRSQVQGGVFEAC
ncbi:hypothetical protein NEOLEDRAFT_292281 [Neolentinus lepideus HHB14362 ss-1]|uniref:Uncharacterized protein n=1 Tax=Neolentinus lepideus HHB14362 ss-1 TaxID=1314782 RepID=A0A165T0E7_9AGAM|nr:hypothetical protein NEOLEDRAFT_292281 [Neolentinus lepideus HHB14362 ss-1]